MPTSAHKLTDSPWLWLLLFSAAGLILLAAMTPKYSTRQRRLEMQYYARQEIAKRQVEGEPAAREVGDEGTAPPPAPGELIIPLWPLGIVLAATLVLSGTMLWRVTKRLSAADDEGAAA